MTANQVSALITARPGPLREGLQALMIAMPQIGTVHEADDVRSAMQMGLEYQPVLVLLDADLAGGETWLAVRRARARWPQSRCVFLANDVQEQQAAEAAGADAALLKGFPAARLVAVLVSLLPMAQAEERVDVGIASPSLHRGRTRRRRQDRVILRPLEVV
jgi:DNA-binding NarL/FixJ family response regulator